MKRHGVLGPAAPEHGWVPAPRYLLRRARVLRQLRRLPATEVLEIGCGAGVLLHELDDMGFRCTALESSPEARQLAGQLAKEAGKDIRFVDSPEADWYARFPLVMAFEVLEHIENDIGALQAWRDWTAPNGILLLSVPSHMAKWNPSDVWAGHFRRYERAGLVAVMEQAGFEVEHIECYGFPLANVAEKVRAANYAPEVDEQVDSTPEGMQANSGRSGIDRRHVMRWFPLLDSLPGRMAMTAAEWSQRPFVSTELGNGYLVRARKM
jgi:SAM-dependent methyltransferase